MPIVEITSEELAALERVVTIANALVYVATVGTLPETAAARAFLSRASEAAHRAERALQSKASEAARGAEAGPSPGGDARTAAYQAGPISAAAVHPADDRDALLWALSGQFDVERIAGLLGWKYDRTYAVYRDAANRYVASR